MFWLTDLALSQLPMPSPLVLPTIAGIGKCRVLGKPHEDSPLIVVHGEVIDELVAYSSGELQREIGAFLYGVVHQRERPVVEVRHYLPALETRSDAASLTFTHDTWAALHRQASQQFPDEKLLGWHHTHPGLGVFLSPHDRFIQQHFFHEPWQIALVVDPRRCEFGFFQWRGGEVVDCGFLLPERDAG